MKAFRWDFRACLCSRFSGAKGRIAEMVFRATVKSMFGDVQKGAKFLVIPRKRNSYGLECFFNGFQRNVHVQAFPPTERGICHISIRGRRILWNEFLECWKTMFGAMFFFFSETTYFLRLVWLLIPQREPMNPKKRKKKEPSLMNKECPSNKLKKQNTKLIPTNQSQ